MRLLVATLLLCLVLPAPGQAVSDGKDFYRDGYSQKQTVKVKRVHARKRTATSQVANAPVQWGASQVVSHPPGCPPRAFCGCGVALDVFGRHVRELWLARNWFRFPRTSPAAGMVAVRRNHVFVIREVRGPNLVLAYDPNSGGRKTRLHVRSLRGFTVVNPRRYASAL